MSDHDYGWRPYVSVATRRRRAAQTVAKLQRSERVISPVTIEGRKIAQLLTEIASCAPRQASATYFWTDESVSFANASALNNSGGKSVCTEYSITPSGLKYT